jgi:DNA-binding protein Fis
MIDEPAVPAAFEKVLKTDIRKYIDTLRKLENGGDLHGMVVSLVERSLLEVTLSETKGNQTEASHILGLNRNTLRRKLKEYQLLASGIDKPARKNGNGNGRKR